MVYIFKSEVTFENKEDAFAFVNFMEQMKAQFVKEQRPNAKPEFSIKSSMQLWESDHDGVDPSPCRLLVAVAPNSEPRIHDINGYIYYPERIIPNDTVLSITNTLKANSEII